MEIEVSEQDNYFEISIQNTGRKTLRNTYVEIANETSKREPLENWKEEQSGVGFYHQTALHPQQGSSVCRIIKNQKDKLQITVYFEDAPPKIRKFKIIEEERVDIQNPT